MVLWRQTRWELCLRTLDGSPTAFSGLCLTEHSFGRSHMQLSRCLLHGSAHDAAHCLVQQCLRLSTTDYSEDQYKWFLFTLRTSPSGSDEKSLGAMQETQVQFLGQDPLEKGISTHCSILQAEDPDSLQSMGSQKVGHNRETKHFSLSLLYLNVDRRFYVSS